MSSRKRLNRSALRAWATVSMALLFTLPAPAQTQGIRWSTLREITPRSVIRQILYPAISYSEGRDSDGKSIPIIHVAYKDNYIYYIRSTDNGRHWTTPVQVSTSNLPNGHTDVLAYNNYVHVAYVSRVVDQNNQWLFQIFHTYSGDYGRTFNPPRRISQSDNMAYAPHLVLTQSGSVALVYYEISERTVEVRRGADLRIFETILENPVSAVLSAEQREILHTSIRIQVSHDNGASFEPSRNVRDLSGTIESFTVYGTDPGNGIAITYETRRGFHSIESFDDGISWEPNPIRNQAFKPFELVNAVMRNGEVYAAGIPFEPGAEVPVFFDGPDVDRKLIARKILAQFPPALVFGGGEIHLVFSAVVQGRHRLLYLRSDRTPPRSLLLWPRDPNVDTMELEFRWTGFDDLSSEEELEFSYNFPDLAGGDWSAFASVRDLTIRSPQDGVYTFMLRSRDKAGNVEPNPISFKFNTYSIAPETFILTRLPPTVVSRYVEIEWEGRDNEQRKEELYYSYRIDDQPWSEFTRTTSSRFGPLTEGGHTVVVRARDSQGNVDATPAQISFTVDLGIEVVWTQAPPMKTSEDQIEFNWRARDQTGEDAVFEYSVKRDHLRWSPYQRTPGITMANLTEGPHRIYVRARDVAGNLSSVLQHSFTVDQTPPQFNFELTRYLGLDPATGYPRIFVSASDNFTQSDNLRAFYRYGNEWHETKLGEINVPTRIDWWSPGYILEIVVRDEVGNQSPQAFRVPLRLTDRLLADKTQLFIILGGFIGGIVLVVLLIVFVLTQRRAQPAPISDEEEVEKVKPEEAPSSRTGMEEDDLFSDDLDSPGTTLEDDDSDLFE